MTGGVAESWARLRLVQGDSSAQVWELVASRGQTTLMVGSGPSSSWVIREEGVRPLHFSLHWDGATLRIADTYGAGDVRVDGEQVTAQWRTIVGRARIDFGKAAMVAETSAGAESESHPLEPSPLPPITNPAPVAAQSADAAAAQRLQLKATLIGVSPLSAEPAVDLVTPRAESSPSAAESPAAGDSSPPREAAGSFRGARPTDSDRARKATLLGMAISVPASSPVPSNAGGASSADQGSPERPYDAAKPPPAQRGIPSGTLMGVVGPLEARVQRLATAAQEAKVSDKRTMLGVPLADLRIGEPAAPQVARPAGDSGGGMVTQVEVRSVSTPPTAKPGERIGSTWQEIPSASRQETSPPMAVLVDGQAPAAGQTRARGDAAGRSFDHQRSRTGGFDSQERVSDMPTQMRDVGSLDSRRPTRGIPLRYIGIVVLTAAAYLAWLYLLDHL